MVAGFCCPCWVHGLLDGRYAGEDGEEEADPEGWCFGWVVPEFFVLPLSVYMLSRKSLGHTSFWNLIVWTIAKSQLALILIIWLRKKYAEPSAK